MKTEPFITIGIASYNYARFLQRAFEAIKRQKFTDFEVLYCDDGSTDNSVQIIQGFIDNNPNMDIRLVRGENGGVMVNKNRILDNARGKYLMICDADDYMDDHCLEVLAKAAIETNADRVVSYIRNVDTQGKILKIQTFPESASKWTEILHHGALYRYGIIDKYKLRFQNRKPDDFCFVTSFDLYTKKVAFVHEAVYNWVIHQDSEGNGNRSWTGDKILSGVLEQVKEIRPLLTLKTDRLLLECEAIKYYFYHVLKCATKTSWAECKQIYVTSHEMMMNEIPDYLENPYIRSTEGSPFRTNLRIEMLCMSFLEKMNVFILFLRGINLLSKFKEVNL